MKILAWIASLALALIAVSTAANLRAWGSPSAPAPLYLYLLPASVLLAATLIFPPLWRGDRARRSEWPRLIAAAILAAIGLFTPIPSHAVKVDVTPAATGR